jgi:hypothetical protein
MYIMYFKAVAVKSGGRPSHAARLRKMSIPSSSLKVEGGMFS